MNKGMRSLQTSTPPTVADEEDLDDERLTPEEEEAIANEDKKAFVKALDVLCHRAKEEIVEHTRVWSKGDGVSEEAVERASDRMILMTKVLEWLEGEYPNG